VELKKKIYGNVYLNKYVAQGKVVCAIVFGKFTCVEFRLIY